jgi:hypothetical protein
MFWWRTVFGIDFMDRPPRAYGTYILNYGELPLCHDAEDY